MLELSRELLERPPEETARLLALSFLDEADDGAKRMEEGEDPEALHDFRVGLRRLRSGLQAYRPYLKGSISKKLQRQLKTLTSSTNQARDTEVQIAWLVPQADKMSDQQTIGLDWLVDNLTARQNEARSPSIKKVLGDFHALHQEFIKKLRVCEYRLDLTQQRSRPSFLYVTGLLLGKHLAELQNDLDQVHSVADQEKMHNARIRGKRLRYLLEPLRKEVPPAKSLVKQFKSLQDVLGELHDTSVLEAEISTALEKSAIEGARRLHEAAMTEGSVSGIPVEDEWKERHGLLELLRLLKARGAQLFSKLETEYLAPNGARFYRCVEDLGKQLSAGIEDREKSHRRFLLRRMPERTKNAPRQLIEEGWLPSKNELLRKVRSGRSVSYFRILQSDSSPLAERISRKYFQTLWPLTERRRLRKRCYEIADADSIWLISEFENRELVLAETDLSPGQTDITLPDWMEACVKRDVTGDQRYEGISLATSPRRKPLQNGPVSPAVPLNRPLPEDR